MRPDRSSSLVACATPRKRPSGDVAATDRLMPHTDHAPMGGFSVILDGERLTIPGRISHGSTWATGAYGFCGRTVDPWEKEGDLVASMAAAIHTRYGDGWVRQRFLRRLLAAPVLARWMIPFIVQLVGEYVVEIIDDIAEALPDL